MIPLKALGRSILPEKASSYDCIGYNYDMLRQLDGDETFFLQNYVHKKCPTPLCMLFKDNDAALFPARS